MYEEALRGANRNPPRLWNGSRICLSSLETVSPRAESTLNQALDLAPNAATWIQLGMVLLQQEKAPDATAAF